MSFYQMFIDPKNMHLCYLLFILACLYLTYFNQFTHLHKCVLSRLMNYYIESKNLSETGLASEFGKIRAGPQKSF